MSGYALGAGAALDLEDIWEFIAQDDVDAADRWIDKLYDGFEALARTPGMGIGGKILRSIRCCSGRLELI